MKLQLINFILLLLFIGSCKQVPEMFTGYPLVYSSEVLDNSLPFALQHIKCNGISNDKIEICLTIRNTINSPTIISMTSWELETLHGLRSALENPSENTIHLLGNEQKEIVLRFRPINDLHLYRLTGLHGSLLQSYSLNFESKVVAHFNLSEDMHTSYLQYQTLPTPYSLSIPMNFIQQQTEYMHAMASPQTSVKASEQEILIGGLNILLKVYHQADTINVQMRLINHSNFPVSVRPNSIVMHSTDQVITPLSFANDSLLIPKSQRAQLNLKYPSFALPPESLTFDISSITFVTPKIIPVIGTQKLIFKQHAVEEIHD